MTGSQPVSTEFNPVEFQNAYPEGINNHYWNHARNHIILREIRNSGQPVIEIGCGRGGVVAFLKQKNIDIFGVELAPCTPFEEAQGHIVTGTDACSLDQEVRSRFKTMLLLDVIEHIEAPEVFLKDLLKHYPNVCELLITVPARQEIWSNYDEFYGHYRRYDLEATKALSDKLQLGVRSNYYFFHSLYLPARYLARKNKKRPLKIQAPASAPAKGLHQLLSFMFRMENRLLPGTWKGSSVLLKATLER